MPKYIIRLDDACPQMNKNNWEKVEEILNKYKIQPVVAVIPNNKDETLYYNNDEDFWNTTIKRWQNKNWHLALHGYEHVYHPTNKISIIPLKNKSEFTGDNYDTQKNKILNGIKILNSNNIYPTTFIAPGHSFDEITIEVLNNETDIKIISDGFSFRPYKKYKINWIPQQLWNFRKMPFGVWTICLHPNTMNENDFIKMENWIKKYHKKIISINDVIENKLFQKYNLFDYLFTVFFKLIKKIN